MHKVSAKAFWQRTFSQAAVYSTALRAGAAVSASFDNIDCKTGAVFTIFYL